MRQRNPQREKGAQISSPGQRGKMMKQTLVFIGISIFALASLSAEGQVLAMEPLFNGKNLSGWKEVGGGKWSVQDGTIVGETGDGRYGWLVTDRAYADFILQLKFKTEGAGNSGVQFRSHVFDTEMKGLQADVDPKPTGNTGSVWDEDRRNRWMAVCSEEGKKAYKPGEWNDYEIAARGDRVVIRLNGVKTVDFRDDMAIKGIIALQVHSGRTPVKVRWKDIRIADLGYGPGWTSLFNGRDFTGWKEHGREKWAVEDGAIVGASGAGGYGYMSTLDTYKDFIVRIAFKCDAEGNSGLFFRSVLEGTDIRGIQCEIDPTPRNLNAGLYESGGRGWIAEPGEDARKLFRFNDWNEMAVKAVEGHYVTYLNGLKAVDLADTRQMSDASSRKDTPKPPLRQGVIALQLHSGGGAKVRWKDIFLKEIAAPKGKTQ